MTQPLSTASAAQFPNTQWSAILALQDGAASHAREKALRGLCGTYWFPLYAFARKRGLSSHDAEDAVQNFFHDIGDADFFQKADQEKGRLRSFILIAFTRMLSDQHRHAHTQKRGGEHHHLSLDVGLAEGWLGLDAGAESNDPILSFERHWALTIMRNALIVLRKECEGSPKAAARFEVLSQFLNLETPDTYPMGKAAEELGMSVSAVSRAIHRLRQHFRLAVRDLVAGTLQNPDEATVTEEMIQLQKALLSR